MSAPIATLRVESAASPGDVPVPRPRLSWTTVTETPGWRQVRAEIERDGEEISAVDGDASVFVAWPFDDVAAHAVHSLRVRVAGAGEELGPWSDPVAVRATFLASGEWRAELVQPYAVERDAQPFRVRHEFMVRAGLVRATLFATALGVYQAHLNGTVVDDQVLKPGWTPYRDRLIHESTEVTALLREDAVNAIAVDVAGGWFTEFWFRPQPRYGAQASVAAQIRLEYADGSVEIVASDASWKASTRTPIVSSSLYDGEHVDAREDSPGWREPGFAGDAWHDVRFDRLPVVPTARTSPAVRVTQEIAPVEISTTSDGAQRLDFGQNLVGRLRLRLRGSRGEVVTLRHAEVLENGELGVRPLRAAKATDSYTFGDDGEVMWEPQFTFHGFRYAEVSAGSRALTAADVSAVVIHSDMRRTGWFTTSDPLLERFHENVVWGMRGNFLYLPTDCPQRDERLGWTGDIQVFSPTASFLYDANSFLSSWLEDLAIEQRAAGGEIVPFIVPNVIIDAATPTAAWGDAATVVPAVLHERFGDEGVLRAQFASMCGWTDHVLRLTGDEGLWRGGFQFGDWLDPLAPPDDAFAAMTSHDLVATAYVMRSADITARTAALLGDDARAEVYRAAADRVREAFVRAFVLDGARMTSDTQTAYALALEFDLVRDDEVRARLAERLADLVEANRHRIGTGFVGTPIISDALTGAGRVEVAGELLLATENPSWLYPVTMGATTIWERWDSMLEDGSINPGEMTSFNHYALGAVADWMHRSLVGLAPAAPGYRRIRIAPHPIARLDHAEAVLDSPYGRIRSGWRREGNVLVVSAEVPPNTTADVVLPDGSAPFEVGSGAHRWEVVVDASPHPLPDEAPSVHSDG